jgi:hypothetical protein
MLTRKGVGQAARLSDALSEVHLYEQAFARARCNDRLRRPDGQLRVIGYGNTYSEVALQRLPLK